VPIASSSAAPSPASSASSSTAGSSTSGRNISALSASYVRRHPLVEDVVGHAGHASRHGLRTPAVIERSEDREAVAQAPPGVTASRRWSPPGPSGASRRPAASGHDPDRSSGPRSPAAGAPHRGRAGWRPCGPSPSTTRSATATPPTGAPIPASPPPSRVRWATRRGCSTSAPAPGATSPQTGRWWRSSRRS
jgi:hypothetical protein